MVCPAVIAIDQGTTNTKAVLFATDGTVLATRSCGVPVRHPRAGWAEQSAAEIWQAVQTVLAGIAAEAQDCEITAIGISNQRETVLLWDRQSGQPVSPAVLWQCRRSSALCDRLRAADHEDMVLERTGLVLDPLFPSGKIRWLLEEHSELRPRAERGELAAGTIDSWLLWNLTGGTVHAIDHSNAARTQLFDIGELRWSPDLLTLFDVPPALLPEVRSSDALFGVTAAGTTALGSGVPIHGMIGDSHAALYGHGVREPGQAKVTCGTGSSVMALTNGRIRSGHGLSSTIAWSRSGKVAYALEGNISVSGQAARFASTMLGLADEEALTELAGTTKDSDGVTFVPALAGLGAPHWNDRARGLICGMSLRTTPAHLARAALDAIAHQIFDVVAAMEADLGQRLRALAADGGGSRSDFLMQLLADLGGLRMLRPPTTEASALGAARLAAESIGVWRDLDGVASDSFNPSLPDDDRLRLRTQWQDALARACLSPPLHG